MNELESVDIFSMSEHPKRISSHEVTASQIHATYMEDNKRCDLIMFYLVN